MFAAVNELPAAGCTSARAASRAGLHLGKFDIKYNYTVSVVPLWVVPKAKKRIETYFVSMRRLAL